MIATKPIGINEFIQCLEDLHYLALFKSDNLDVFMVNTMHKNYEGCIHMDIEWTIEARETHLTKTMKVWYMKDSLITAQFQSLMIFWPRSSRFEGKTVQQKSEHVNESFVAISWGLLSLNSYVALVMDNVLLAQGCL